MLRPETVHRGDPRYVYDWELSGLPPIATSKGWGVIPGVG
jgi:hypothetical protein